MSGECDPDDLLAIIGDEYVRSILSATSEEAMSAKRLSERCGASLPTVYRRIDDLLEYGFLAEEVEMDPDGNHFKTYEATVEHIEIELVDGNFEVAYSTREEDAVDRFTRMWRQARGDE
ncbi:helix-turn-helix domain-containing protein [Haladaptatus sp. NG-SE-30]